jgi:hypothetical protein
MLFENVTAQVRPSNRIVNIVAVVVAAAAVLVEP